MTLQIKSKQILLNYYKPTYQKKMSQQSIQALIQKSIQPLYSKIQQLEKENQQLKRRVAMLQTHFQSQNAKSYMKNTASRQNQLLTEGSKISRKDDDNRSMSGSREKPGWKNTVKLQDQKPIIREPVHHQKMKLKPPIPRMNSKTPPKFTQQRPKSPQTQKKLFGGQKVQAEKKQISSQTKNANEVTENIASPRNIAGRQFDDPSASNVSKGSSLKLGKPNIYIQKQAKLNTVSVSSPRQLDRSSLTEKPIGSGSSQVTQQNSEQKLAKSQLSINSDKNKVNSLEITN